MNKRLRIAILSDAKNTHTKRWVKALAQQGNDILLFSLAAGDNFYDYIPNVKVVSSNLGIHDNFFDKIKYFTVLPILKKSLRDFKPDIINAHYASSYGTLGVLSGFHPLLISVWGSDIYIFPKSIPFGGNILRYSLNKADYILSTSNVMALETKKYTDKEIAITPFGVDTELFKPQVNKKKGNTFVVGNVKTLAPVYGIDVLIKAFKIVVNKNPFLDLRLEIYGDGPHRDEYEALAKSLSLENLTTFHGFVDNSLLPKVYNSFDVAVSLSHSESFGVVAVEAMACECPVVTSDAEGFTEVVKDGVTGIIVPKGNIEAAAEAIQRFIDNPYLKESMGKEGRKRVKELYDWNKNVSSMIDIYKTILNDH